MNKKKLIVPLVMISAFSLASCTDTLEDCQRMFDTYYLQVGLDAEYAGTSIKTVTKVNSKDEEVLAFYGVEKSGDSVTDSYSTDENILYTLEFAQSCAGILLDESEVGYDLIDMIVTITYTYNGDLSEYIGLEGCEGKAVIEAKAVADGRVDTVEKKLTFTRNEVKSTVTVTDTYTYTEK